MTEYDETLDRFRTKLIEMQIAAKAAATLRQQFP